MEPIVQLAPGAGDHGLATMLAGLIRQNVDDKPAKKSVLTRLEGRVAIVAKDADAAVTLDFHAGCVTVYGGIVGIPDLTVRASTEDITKLSLLELSGPLALPDPRGHATREIARASARGRIKVHGLLPNLPLVFRLARVMSVS